MRFIDIIKLAENADFGYRVSMLAEYNIPLDQTLDAEFKALGDVLVEVANLPTRRTGIEGTVWISTKMTGHGPRVKYFVKPGSDQPSFSVSIGPNPELKANSLPEHIKNHFLEPVSLWVAQNNQALLDYWNHGDTWDSDQVQQFIENLRSV